MSYPPSIALPSLSVEEYIKLGLLYPPPQLDSKILAKFFKTVDIIDRPLDNDEYKKSTELGIKHFIKKNKQIEKKIGFFLDRTFPTVVPDPRPKKLYPLIKTINGLKFKVNLNKLGANVSSIRESKARIVQAYENYNTAVKSILLYKEGFNTFGTINTLDEDGDDYMDGSSIFANSLNQASIR